MEKGKRVAVVNVSKWIEENKQYFLPPVCNKLMHTGGQVDVMFVGGPNVRKDFHIEAGEELFLQVKGDMTLKVLERGQHKDVVIKEGEIFLLPRAIPHSPQRFPNTVGLVVERQRQQLEPDGLRFFTEDEGQLSTETLYETWFAWGKKSMPELFEEFYNSEQCKIGKPIPGTIMKDPPIAIDTKTSLQAPFSLHSWIEDNRKKIDKSGKLEIFDSKKHQMQVFACGRGDTTDISDVAEIWIWQMTGEGLLECLDEKITLSTDDSALIPIGSRFTLHQKEEGLALMIYQDPTKSPYYPTK